MKVKPTSNNRIGLFIWMMARHLQICKRNVRLLKIKKAPIDVIEFSKGEENEAHNRYQAAKAWFEKEIAKQ